MKRAMQGTVCGVIAVVICVAGGLLQRSAMAADSRVLRIGDFRSGTDGFDGAFRQDSGDGKTGAGCAILKNEVNGWVEGGKDLQGLKNGFAEVSLWVKSTTVASVAVRLNDATGQAFQHRLSFAEDGQWHQLKITKLADAQSWGGAGDKKWHSPATRIQIILEGGHNDVKIDDIEAVLDDVRIVPLLEVSSSTSGNIFMKGEKAVLSVKSTADTIEYKIRDFHNAVVGAGQERMVDGRAAIAAPANRLGFFSVQVAATKGGKVVADQITNLAVISPAAINQRENGPFGVMTHFAQAWDPDILPLLKKAGINYIRDEYYWTHIEREKGKFTFMPAWDRYMADAKSNGLDKMFAATFGNPLYTGTWDGAPATPEARDAYANYAVQVVKRFPEIKTLEIWNEYNGSWCGGEAQKDRSKYYAEMIKVAYPRLKAVRPDIEIGGCACISIPLPYIEGIFKNGAMPFMDAIVIHSYRSQPEGGETEIAELQELIRKYNNGKDKPIWVTETGHGDEAEYDWEKGKGLATLGRTNVAQYLVRQYALLLSTGTITKINWYLSRDYNEFKTMGLLGDAKDPRGRYAVQPAYVAYSTLIRELSGAVPVGRAKTGKFTYIEQFNRDKQETRVCWATVPAHVALKVSAPVTVADIMGEEEVLTPVGGEVYLTLTESPLYVKGKVDAILEGGKFSMAGTQTIDLLADYGFDYSVSDPSISGSIQVMGKSYPLDSKGGRIVIPGQDTTKPRTDTLWYRMYANGKLAGKGGIELVVTDPLNYGGTAEFSSDHSLRIRVSNTSRRKEYALASVNCNVDGSVASRQVAATLPVVSSSVIDLSMDAIRPYIAYTVGVDSTFAGRVPLRQNVQTSFNPCMRKTIGTDADTADWTGVPAIDLKTCAVASNGGVTGTVQMAWDDANLYLLAQAPEGTTMTFGLAPDVAGRWAEQTADLRGWYVLRLDQTGSVTVIQSPNANKVNAAARKTRGQSGYEIAIPWSQLKPISPSGKDRFRMSLVASNGNARSEWGGGLRRGQTPDEFRTCMFETGKADIEAGKMSISTKPLGEQLADQLVTQPLAKSDDDYAKVQGKNNWYYGYYYGDGQGQGDGQAPKGPYTDDDFQLMSIVVTPWGDVWQGKAPFNTMASSNGHPSVVDGRQVWAVRRWKSTISGTIRITGSFEHDQQGDGIGGKILVDGVQVFSILAGGPSYEKKAIFDVVVPVRMGSLVDFAITPGLGLNIDYDNGVFSAKLEQASKVR